MRFILSAMFCLLLCLPAQAGDVAFREEFKDLSAWEHITFPNNGKSLYELVPNGNGNLLKITAKATNSGLLMNKDVPTAEYPILRWKWKVDNVYEKGDIRKRQTDDSPLRIYVLFDEGPPYESFGERLQYNAMRTFYGKAAPRSALIYFWSSKELSGYYIPDWETSLVWLIQLQKGTEKTGQWIEESVDIARDYRKVFKMEPPAVYRIMICGDADDTQETGISWMEYIEAVSRAQALRESGKEAISLVKEPSLPATDGTTVQ